MGNGRGNVKVPPKNPPKPEDNNPNPNPEPVDGGYGGAGGYIDFFDGLLTDDGDNTIFDDENNIVPVAGRLDENSNVTAVHTWNRNEYKTLKELDHYLVNNPGNAKWDSDYMSYKRIDEFNAYVKQLGGVTKDTYEDVIHQIAVDYVQGISNRDDGKPLTPTQQLVLDTFQDTGAIKGNYESEYYSYQSFGTDYAISNMEDMLEKGAFHIKINRIYHDKDHEKTTRNYLKRNKKQRELFELALNTFDVLTQKHPEVGSYLLGIERDDPGTVAFVKPLSKVMKVTPFMLTSHTPKKYTDQSFNAGTTFESDIAHEFGHLVHLHLSDDETKTSYTSVSPLENRLRSDKWHKYNQFLKDTQYLEGVSGYANYSTMEAFAEAFAIYTEDATPQRGTEYYEKFVKLMEDTGFGDMRGILKPNKSVKTFSTVNRDVETFTQLREEMKHRKFTSEQMDTLVSNVSIRMRKERSKTRHAIEITKDDFMYAKKLGLPYDVQVLLDYMFNKSNKQKVELGIHLNEIQYAGIKKFRIDRKNR